MKPALNCNTQKGSALYKKQIGNRLPTHQEKDKKSFELETVLIASQKELFM